MSGWTIGIISGSGLSAPSRHAGPEPAAIFSHHGGCAKRWTPDQVRGDGEFGNVR
jgi:hypothetical protein